MNILVASSKEHIQYYSVMLESLYINNPQEKIDVYIIYDCSVDIDWGALREQADKYQNRIFTIPVDEKKFAAFPKISAKWPRILYFKLLAADLLPPHLDRVLLLESDMIITKSLALLYMMDFDGNHVIASDCLPRYWGRLWRDGRNEARLKDHLGLPQELDLFGGGAMVLNLEKIRADRIGFDTISALAEQLQYSWGAPEETLFWKLFIHSRKKVDAWSYYLSPPFWEDKKGDINDKNSPYGTIIHYNLCNKPWDSYVLDTECELDRIWWSYAKRTAYYEEIRTHFEHRLLDREDVKEVRRTLENVDFYYQTLIRWKYMQDACGTDALEHYLIKKGYFKVAIYGINPLQMLLCNELRSSTEITIPYLVDSVESRQMGGYQIQRAADCSFDDVDVIIVAAFLHYEAIKKNVEHAPCSVLSLQDILDELLPERFNQHVN